MECDRRASSPKGPIAMPEAVIVDAIRTPIGRAFKGSLASLRPDETLAYVVDRVLERNPEVDPASVEELVAGCGQPQGLQANNIAVDTINGTVRLTGTVNSWSEHDAAVAAAWAAPGVIEADDRVSVRF